MRASCARALARISDVIPEIPHQIVPDAQGDNDAHGTCAAGLPESSISVTVSRLPIFLSHVIEQKKM